MIYEDEGLMVVNKPSGIAVHGGSGVAYGLIEGLRAATGKSTWNWFTGLTAIHQAWS